MAEVGCDENDHLLDNQDDYDDDDADIQMDEFSSQIPTVNKAETSFGGISQSLTKSRTQIRNDTVDDFYKSIGYEPRVKYSNNFEHKDGKLAFIKDGKRFILYNAKERGKSLALSTLATRYGVDFIRFDLGITD